MEDLMMEPKPAWPSRAIREGRARLGRCMARLPEPEFTTPWGAAYLGDSLELLPRVPSRSVSLIITSPPFALRKKKKYGNQDPENYVEWFLRFAKEFHRVLCPRGSLVIDIGGAWNKREPTRSLYHFRLLITLCEMQPEPFYLAQEFYWYNPAKLPTPAQWVTVERIRAKDAVNTVWWLSKSPRPYADNRQVLVPYGNAMKRLLEKGYNAGPRPCEHKISAKWRRDNGGAIPPNIIIAANTSSNDQYLRGCRRAGLKAHPARFPDAVPRFFIRFLTKPGQLVLDPFAGSNVAGYEAELLARHWLAFEERKAYLVGAQLRFPNLCLTSNATDCV